jgi:hypothetical protein
MTRIFHTIRVLMFAAASPLLAAAPVTIGKPDSLVLEFAADARPKSLRVAAKELLDTPLKVSP